VKKTALTYAIAAVAVFCILGLNATFDAQEEERAEAYKQETIRRQMRPARLARIERAVRIQIAEASK